MKAVGIWRYARGADACTADMQVEISVRAAAGLPAATLRLGAVEMAKFKRLIKARNTGALATMLSLIREAKP